MTDVDTGDQATRKAECETVERLINGWRTRIDEAKLQADLATKDVRDELGKTIGTAENMWLAARSRLSDARADSVSDLAGMRHDVEQLLHDLKGVLDATTAVLRRTR